MDSELARVNLSNYSDILTTTLEIPLNEAEANGSFNFIDWNLPVAVFLNKFFL